MPQLHGLGAQLARIFRRRLVRAHLERGGGIGLARQLAADLREQRAALVVTPGRGRLFEHRQRVALAAGAQ